MRNCFLNNSAMSKKSYFLVTDFVWLFVTVTAIERHSGVDLDSSGSFTTFKFGVKPSDKKCHDFCALMSELCRNGGSCVMDDDTCIATCICAPGWAGRWCRDDVSLLEPEKSDNTTESTGPSLATLDFSKIGNDIKDNGDSVTDDVMKMVSNVRVNKTSPFEIRTSKMIGVHRDVNISMETSGDSKFDIGSSDKKPNLSDVSNCLETCTDGDCIAKDEQYVCTRRIDVSKLKGPKTCQPGFVCQHGVCDMEAKDKGLKCICEPNYIGTFCEMKCPFDCGDHGVCDFHVDDNQMKCFCQWNYTGLNCSELIPLPPGLYIHVACSCYNVRANSNITNNFLCGP